MDKLIVETLEEIIEEIKFQMTEKDEWATSPFLNNILGKVTTLNKLYGNIR